MISIPALPEMLEALEVRGDLNYNPEELDNYISGLFVIGNGVGEAVGPILSACLNEGYGFRTAQFTYSSVLMLYALVYFFAVGHFSICSRTPKEQ